MEHDVVMSDLEFPEGMIVGEDRIWVAEVLGGRVTEATPEGQRSRRVGGGPCGLALGSEGSIFIADNGGVISRGSAFERAPSWAPRVAILGGSAGTAAAITPAEVLAGPNDLVADPWGDLWFTDPGLDLRSRTGTLCRVEPGTLGVQIQAHDLRYPNGLAVGPGGTCLLVAETGSRRILRYPLIERGRVGPSSVFATMPDDCFPDGLCVGDDGRVVVAGTAGGSIVEFDATGALLGRTDVGEPLVSNVCFGPGRSLHVVLPASGRVVRMEWPVGGASLSLVDERNYCAS